MRKEEYYKAKQRAHAAGARTKYTILSQEKGYALVQADMSYEGETITVFGESVSETPMMDAIQEADIAGMTTFGLLDGSGLAQEPKKKEKPARKPEEQKGKPEEPETKERGREAADKEESDDTSAAPSEEAKEEKKEDRKQAVANEPSEEAKKEDGFIRNFMSGFFKREDELKEEVKEEPKNSSKPEKKEDESEKLSKSPDSYMEEDIPEEFEEKLPPMEDIPEEAPQETVKAHDDRPRETRPDEVKQPEPEAVKEEPAADDNFKVLIGKYKYQPQNTIAEILENDKQFVRNIFSIDKPSVQYREYIAKIKTYMKAHNISLDD